MQLATKSNAIIRKGNLLALNCECCFIPKVCCYPGGTCNDSPSAGEFCPDGGVNILPQNQALTDCLLPVRDPNRTTAALSFGVIHRNRCCRPTVTVSSPNYQAFGLNPSFPDNKYLDGLLLQRFIVDDFFTWSLSIVSRCGSGGASMVWAATAEYNNVSLNSLFAYRASVTVESSADDACLELYHADYDLSLFFTGGVCLTEGIPTGVGEWTLSQSYPEIDYSLFSGSPVVDASNRTVTVFGSTFEAPLPTAIEFDYQPNFVAGPLP